VILLTLSNQKEDTHSHKITDKSPFITIGGSTLELLLLGSDTNTLISPLAPLLPVLLF
jgi:hypothetical protein